MAHPRSASGAPPPGGAASGPAKPDPRRPLGPPRRRGLRPAAVLFVVLALFVAALAAGLWSVLRSEAGAAWLLGQVPGLRITGPRGTLIGDFAAERIEFALPRGGRVVLHAPAWRGLRVERVSGGAPWRIVVERLQAERVEIVPGAPSPDPLQVPSDLRLPLELVVEALDVRQLDAPPLGATPLRDLRARLHLGADGGAMHRVDGVSLAFDRLRATGALQIGTSDTLPLQVRVALAQEAPLANARWSAEATLAGPLAEPALKATLRAEPLAAPGAASAPARPATPAPAPTQSLDLAATLRPFQPWPLGELQARAQALDLSAFASGAPVTSLSGSASAVTQSMSQPATLEARLENAAAGLWNEGRLPVRRATVTLRARPDDPGNIELVGLDAELGTARQAAGRIEASGRWTAAAWSFDALLKELQPAALDARAAAMALSGPLKLRGSRDATAGAMRVETEAGLAGRLGGAAPQRNVQLQLDATWSRDAARERIDVRRALASAGGAKASLAGTAERAADTSTWTTRGRAELVEFDPLPWWRGREDSPWRRGPHRLNATGEFDLVVPAAPAAATPAERIAALRGNARVAVARSLLGGVPIGGELGLRGSAAAPLALTLALEADGNRIAADGRLATRAGSNDDSWDLKLDAPTLAKLEPLWRLVRGNEARLAGSLRASGSVAGRWPATLTTRGEANATALRIDAVTAKRADLRWQLGTRMDAPVEAQLQLDGLAAGRAALEALELRLRGTGRAHTLEARAASTLRPPEWTDTLQPGTAGSGNSAATLAAQGGFVDGPAGTVAGWRGSVQQIELRSAAAGAPPWVRSGDVALELGWAADGSAARVTVQPGRAEVLGAALSWSHVAWRAASANAPAQLEARAELAPLAIAPLLARLQPDFGWGGDLTVAGRLDVRSAPTFAADIVLERRAGDLTVTDEIGTQALGLSDLRLGLNAAGGTWSFTQALAGSTLGVAAGAIVARTTPTATWPAADTPVEGVLEVRVANLGTWGTWVPAGWRLGGELHTSASIGGRFGAPQYTGAIRGSGLSVRNFVQGVAVSDGEVVIALQGERARIERFRARGGSGTLSLEGDAEFGAAPQAQLRLVAEQFQLLGRVDRRIVASGAAQVRLSRDALALDGRFAVDEGLVDFTRSDAPSLSDDVVVVRAPKSVPTGRAPERAAEVAKAPMGAASAPAVPVVRETPLALPKAALDLRVGLGEKLRVRGRGLDTGLRGELHITSPGGRLQVNGTVRAVDGTYQAYGQKLAIDRGELVFSGPAENPRLDIEATRPNLDVRVGVAVVGSAANPRVRLFSEPEMAEVDKLSWLVLGRASDGLGRTDTALLQRAALALLAGEGPGATDQLISAIGLDELSLRQTDGEVRETIVSLGKQLSRRWYVGYERSLNATSGTWQLIYRIAQRFTLRAQSGLDNSLDAIWTWRWQ